MILFSGRVDDDLVCLNQQMREDSTGMRTCNLNVGVGF
jgi:hypothetical protein